MGATGGSCRTAHSANVPALGAKWAKRMRRPLAETDLATRHVMHPLYALSSFKRRTLLAHASVTQHARHGKS